MTCHEQISIVLDCRVDAWWRCFSGGRCAITVDTRRKCRRCRYQKCLDAGMNPSWVTAEQEKERERKNITRRVGRLFPAGTSPASRPNGAPHEAMEVLSESTWRLERFSPAGHLQHPANGAPHEQPREQQQQGLAGQACDEEGDSNYRLFKEVLNESTS